MAHQRRGVVEHDDVDLVGAQSTSRIAGKPQLKIKATTRIARNSEQLPDLLKAGENLIEGRIFVFGEEKAALLLELGRELVS